MNTKKNYQTTETANTCQNREIRCEVSSRLLLGCAIALALAVGFVFSPIGNFEFINLDDNDYITGNPHVNSGLSWANVHWAFTEFRSGHWHPLSWVSHMIDVEMFGLVPGGHHLVSLGFHIANTVLVFLFFALATKQLLPAAFVALVFGLHPMRIESVAWAAERKDVLSLFFALVSINLYAAFTRQGGFTKFKGTLLYLCCLGTFVLSLLSKPTLVTLPVLLLILDLWPLNRFQISSLKWQTVRGPLLEKLPMLLISLGSSVVTVMAQDAEGALKTLSDYTLDARVSNALTSYLIYAGKLFLPFQVAIFYPFQLYAPGVGAGAFFGLVAASYLCWSARERHPYLFAGWLWFLVSALPTVGFIQFGGQAFADRWSYVPHIGLLAGVTWLFVGVFGDRLGQVGLRSVAPLLIAVCLWRTTVNLPHWASSEKIFRHTLAVSPDNFMALNNLGVTLDEQGKIQEAGPLFERATLIKPTYSPALNNLGSFYARTGEILKARQLFERALASEPGLLLARYHLGLAYAETGEQIAGLLEWSRVLSADPNFQRAAMSFETVAQRILAQGCSGSLAQNQAAALREIEGRLSQIGSGAQSGILQSRARDLLGCFGVAR